MIKEQKKKETKNLAQPRYLNWWKRRKTKIVCGSSIDAVLVRS